MKRKSRIGILTGGGDGAGLNPAIKWVVKTALDERLPREQGIQYEVMGIRDGWKGLISVDPTAPNMSEHIMPLNSEVVRTWDRYGGTLLGTSRTNPYNPKDDRSKTLLRNIEKLGLEAIVAIGGATPWGLPADYPKQG